MQTEEEVEGWYEEEKKKALDALVESSGKKEDANKAEMNYKARLNKTFEKYMELKLKLIGDETAKAKLQAKQKIKRGINPSEPQEESGQQQSALSGIFRKLIRR
ncbi:MAG TPA: hypothetical protein VI934_00465 [Candidatus Nanoarchaeia archaeon]|nr:hypothetical protein [Candidatus Nanoarchaeia archaeon]